MQRGQNAWSDRGYRTHAALWYHLRLPAVGIGGAGLVAFILVLGVALPRPAPAPEPEGGGQSAPVALQTAYGQRPLQFEANQGQASAPVDFLARAPGYTLFLTSGEAVLTLRSGSGPETVNTDEQGVPGIQQRTSAAYTARAVPPVRSPSAEAEVLRVQLTDSRGRGRR